MARLFPAAWILVWHHGAVRDMLATAEQVYALEEPIQHLKQQLNDQQQQVATLQREVAELLGDVRQKNSDLQGVAVGEQPPGTPLHSEQTLLQKKLQKCHIMQDLEGAMMQVMEQDAAMTGQELAETNIPEPLVEKSPEQQMNEAIAAIDKLEALKTHYKYDMQNIQRNYAA